MTALEVFAALVAAPREAGTEGTARARDLLARHFRELGCAVREQHFRFQPAALNAFPLLGAGLGWLTLLQIPLLMLATPAGWLAPLVWFGGAAALGMLAWGIGSGVEVPGAEAREDANLVVTRGEAPVARWVVAHVDTKAQGHSMAGRLVALWVLLLAVAVLSGLTTWRALRGRELPGWVVAAGVGAALPASLLVGRGRLRGATVGARDNGTGLLAALTLAEQGGVGDGVGLLLSGAEEFGLVGARVFAAGLSPGAEVVNLDTITGEGPLYLVAHDRPGLALAQRLEPAFRGLAPVLKTRRLPLGILTDSLPFARRGMPAVTIARLSWADLHRLHTPRDTPDGLPLATAVAVGERLRSAR